MSIVNWNDRLRQHEREVSDGLGILPAKPRQALSVRRIEAIMAEPAFWAGVAQTRAAFLADEPIPSAIGLRRANRIHAELMTGKPLGEIEAFKEWREGRG